MRSIRTAAVWLTGLIGLLGACTGQADRLPLDSYPLSQAQVVSASTDQTHEFSVHLAETPEHRTQGLMYVRELPVDTGMLFIFPTPAPLSFWMKNTLISLDIIFLDTDGRIINISAGAKPRTLSRHVAEAQALGVLEINGGLAEKLGIKPGDRVIHPHFGG